MKTQNVVTVCESMKRKRKAAGFDSAEQVEKATYGKIKADTLYKYENEKLNNEPTISTCIELSKLYGCTLDELVGRC